MVSFNFNGKNLKLVLARDVTERKVSQEQIREREERLRFLVQQMPATLWSVDNELRVTSSLGGGISLLNAKPNDLPAYHLQNI